MPTILDTINLTAYNGLKIGKLLDINATQVMQVTLEKGTEFPKHTSKTDVALVVLEGRLSFYINSQQFELSKHQVFQFAKEEEHSVTAIENSKFLLIR